MKNSPYLDWLLLTKRPGLYAHAAALRDRAAAQVGVDFIRNPIAADHGS
jgi:hypothetical protein